MDKNVGGYDRIARLVAGPILLALGIAALAGVLTLAEGATGMALAVIALLIGVVFLGTALTQKCPLNSLLGINTCPVR